MPSATAAKKQSPSEGVSIIVTKLHKASYIVLLKFVPGL